MEETLDYYLENDFFYIVFTGQVAAVRVPFFPAIYYHLLGNLNVERVIFDPLNGYTRLVSAL